MSASLLRFKANYLKELCGYPNFNFFVDSDSLQRSTFPHGPKLAQKPLYLVGGTILKEQVEYGELVLRSRKKGEYNLSL